MYVCVCLTEMFIVDRYTCHVVSKITQAYHDYYLIMLQGSMSVKFMDPASEP